MIIRVKLRSIDDIWESVSVPPTQPNYKEDSLIMADVIVAEKRVIKELHSQKTKNTFLPTVYEGIVGSTSLGNVGSRESQKTGFKSFILSAG